MQKKRLTIISTCLLCAFGFTSCDSPQSSDSSAQSSSATKLSYMVSFVTNNETTLESIEVTRGSRITDQSVQTLTSTTGAIFVGWYKDADFVYAWDFSIDIITGDTTLYARWIVVESYPTEVQMSNVAFSNTLTWVQSGVDSTTLSEIIFKGCGTLNNPYGVYSELDMYSLTKGGVTTGVEKYYVQGCDFSLEVAYQDTLDTIFQGNYDGDEHTITISTGNAGIFYKLGANANVYDLTLAGTISTGTIASIGGLCDINDGTICNITSGAAVSSTAGIVGDITSKDLGGAGAVVGINNGTISDCLNTATVKAVIGGGRIAAINNGTISNCEQNGTIGAGNAVESGKSLSAYSYSGGIAGFNYGTITQSITTSTGKILAQRYTTSTPTTTDNNRVIGGIVGYNDATGLISECVFSGIRCHGDEYVGGIVGINAGSVDSCYTGALYYETPLQRTYIGARLHVGGIAGDVIGSGTVTNCYNAANVYTYTSNDPAYAIAVSATNCVYVNTNFDGRSTGTFTYGNCITDTLVGPASGSGNVSISNSSLFGTSDDYLFPDYTSVLGNKFVYSETNGTILSWQIA